MMETIFIFTPLIRRVVLGNQTIFHGYLCHHYPKKHWLEIHVYFTVTISNSNNI